MPRIRNERTGTEELLRDGRYHYAALLADPESAHLAQAVKKRLDALAQAAQDATDAEFLRIQQQAMLDRAEYLHDSLQRTLELFVLGAVRKNRRAPAYAEVYPEGLSSLVALVGEEQERSVTRLLQKLAVHHPELHKKYAKELAKLAADAATAEKALNQATAAEDHAFLDELSARGELSRQLRRDEGALISLFPDDRTRVRLYYRTKSRRPEAPAEDPAPSPAAGDAHLSS